MNEEIIEILEEMKEYASGGMTGLYFPEYMIQDLLDYITNLQQKVEQLENIRKEAIDYIENTDFDSEDNIVAKKAKDGIIGAFILENKIPKDLLNILNKGSE